MQVINRIYNILKGRSAMSGFFKKPHPDPLLLGEETENLLLIGGGGRRLEEVVLEKYWYLKWWEIQLLIVFKNLKMDYFFQNWYILHKIIFQIRNQYLPNKYLVCLDWYKHQPYLRQKFYFTLPANKLEYIKIQLFLYLL